MKLFISLILVVSLTLASELECERTLALYPKIVIKSRDINAWLRVLHSPTRALRYGIDLRYTMDYNNSIIIIKCLQHSIHNKDLTLGNKD